MIDYIKGVWKTATAWYGRNTVVGVIGLIVVLLAIGFGLFGGTPAPNEVSETATSTVVEVTKVAQLARGDSDAISLLGSVEAKNQATLVAERGGRVTAVNTTLGARVGAGQILVTFENDAERAQVTQAQGAYQAALAAQAQAGTGIADATASLVNAQNAAVTAYSTAFSGVNQIFVTTIDQYYADINASIPGLRISGGSQTTFLNTERVAFRDILGQWQQTSTRLTSTSPNLEAALSDRIVTLNRFITLLDTFASILPQQATNAGTTQAEWLRQADAMVQARNNAIQLRTALESALTGLTGRGRCRPSS